MNVAPRATVAPQDDVDVDAVAEQFIVTLATCLENARLGGFSVLLQLGDGRRVEGVPAVSVAVSDGPGPFGAAGLAGSVELGGTAVRLHDVRSYTVSRPALVRRP